MSKKCPIGFANGYHCCDRDCVLYQDGCLIKKALELYIKNNTPLVMCQPTEEELNKLTKELKEILAKHPMEPILYRHPDLNIKHDYDEYGVDWYPPGPNDIAP